MFKYIFILASTFLMSFPILGDHGFDNFYCSSVDSDGEWAVAFGKHPADFYCNLIAHELLYNGGEITTQKKGHYAAGDLNEVSVKCNTPESSFKLVDFGSSAIRRAQQQAVESDATHCLFTIREYP